MALLRQLLLLMQLNYWRCFGFLRMTMRTMLLLLNRMRMRVGCAARHSVATCMCYRFHQYCDCRLEMYHFPDCRWFDLMADQMDHRDHFCRHAHRWPRSMLWPCRRQADPPNLHRHRPVVCFAYHSQQPYGVLFADDFVSIVDYRFAVVWTLVDRCRMCWTWRQILQ